MFSRSALSQREMYFLYASSSSRQEVIAATDFRRSAGFWVRHLWNKVFTGFLASLFDVRGQTSACHEAETFKFYDKLKI